MPGRGSKCGIPGCYQRVRAGRDEVTCGKHGYMKELPPEAAAAEARAVEDYRRRQEAARASPAPSPSPSPSPSPPPAWTPREGETFYEVMAPVEPEVTQYDQKTHWVKIGVAFDHRRKDGRIDVVLNALPLGRKIYLWPKKTDER